jgi:hypothetical protein
MREAPAKPKPARNVRKVEARDAVVIVVGARPPNGPRRSSGTAPPAGWWKYL